MRIIAKFQTVFRKNGAALKSKTDEFVMEFHLDLPRRTCVVDTLYVSV